MNVIGLQSKGTFLKGMLLDEWTLSGGFLMLVDFQLQFGLRVLDWMILRNVFYWNTASYIEFF